MRTILGIPHADRSDDVTSLWKELKAKAVPFPFACSDADLSVRWEQTGCDIEMPKSVDAMATFRPSRTFVGHQTAENARICLSERLFDKPRDVQLGVLLHEAMHIRLSSARLQKNFLASLDVEERERARNVFENEDDAKFALVRNTFAHSLLNLVTEIGVDRFMASQYAWISTDYWRARCRNFFVDGARSLIHPQDITTSLQPYAAFYRLVALDLGLLVVTNDEDREALRSRRDAYVAALETTCDEEMASWLKHWLTKLIAFDPLPDDPDPDAYDEVCERVLALTA